MSPQVSVVIAAKNEALHVREAVLSVISQSGLDFELIFVDDGSTDETFAIVGEIAAGYENLKLVRNPSAGKCSAFNFGVSLATGRFVTLFAGDDIMPQGSLSLRLAAIAGEPKDIPVVGLCKLKMLSDRPEENGTIIPKRAGVGCYSGVSYLFNRLALASAFPVPENYPNEDTFLELVVLHLGFKQVHSDVIGCEWRIHAGNSINLRRDFADFNAKYTTRMRVHWTFWDMFEARMAAKDRALVQGKMQLETARAAGSVAGVLTAPVPLRDRLRFLAYTNSFFYGIRQKFYVLLSGT